jgi:hypothetical protein
MRGSHLKRKGGGGGVGRPYSDNKKIDSILVPISFYLSINFNGNDFFFYMNMLQKVDRNQSSCFFIELDFGFFKWLENVLIKVENWFY